MPFLESRYLIPSLAANGGEDPCTYQRAGPLPQDEVALIILLEFPRRIAQRGERQSQIDGLATICGIRGSHAKEFESRSGIPSRRNEIALQNAKEV